jgi:chromate transporter
MQPRSSSGAEQQEVLSRPASRADLFFTFTALALQAFGGVLAVAQRVLCERKRWLGKAQFIELLSLGQVLPGANVCNVSLMVGDRAFGWRGALAALGGLLVVPLVIVLAVTGLYSRFASLPAVAGALKGMGAVAAGLIVGTALKLAGSLRTNPLGVPTCAALAVAVFVLVALLRVPLVWVVIGLGLVACALAWRAVPRGRQ